MLARPHYLPAHHVTAVLTGAGPHVERNSLLLVNNTYGTASGAIRAVPPSCFASAADNRSFYACLRAHGITNRVSVLQPASRLHLFQLIEAGLCVIIATALLALALRQVQRHRAN